MRKKHEFSTSSTIVQRLWNYCNVLRDDGLSYGDYVEQLTYLLFLKMADEQTPTMLGKPSAIPAEFDWASLLRAGRRRAGSALPPHPGRAGQGRRADPGSSSARRRTRSRTRPSCAA